MQKVRRILEADAAWERAEAAFERSNDRRYLQLPQQAQGAIWTGLGLLAEVLTLPVNIFLRFPETVKQLRTTVDRLNPPHAPEGTALHATVKMANAFAATLAAVFIAPFTGFAKKLSGIVAAMRREPAEVAARAAAVAAKREGIELAGIHLNPQRGAAPDAEGANPANAGAARLGDATAEAALPAAGAR